MIAFAPAKINLGLLVKEKRDDGYHNIESILVKTGLVDVVEVVPSSETELTTYGFPIPGDLRENLCLKAYQLLKEEYPVGCVHIHLQKNIPPGSGLGGASSDAVRTLQLLNRLFGLKLSTERLNSLAVELGSDCPFFLSTGAALATGKGTEITQIDTPFHDDVWICILVPESSISTAWAYSHVICSDPGICLSEQIRQPVEVWQDCLGNAFEETAFRAHPEIGLLKEALLDSGAFYASLSGSGSAVYGIFDQEPPDIDIETRLTWIGKLHPKL